MNLHTRPVKIANGADEDGVLVFTDEDRLAAILTQLTDKHEDLAGRWFLETGYGPVDGPSHPTFASLDEALGWIDGRLHAGTGGRSR